MNAKNLVKFLATLIVGMMLTAFAAAQDMHQSSQFQGPKANKGFVTHSERDGKSVLTLSDDFVVPDTPDPHWRVVDSDGNVYDLDKLKKNGSWVCEERVQSDHLVRMGRSQSRRSLVLQPREVSVQPCGTAARLSHQLSTNGAAS